jgi:hypothetical protein
MLLMIPQIVQDFSTLQNISTTFYTGNNLVLGNPINVVDLIQKKERSKDFALRLQKSNKCIHQEEYTTETKPVEEYGFHHKGF